MASRPRFVSERFAVRRHDILVEYRGYDHAIDVAIERTAGRRSSGSGFDLVQGRRDLGFSFGQRPAALRALKRLKRKKKIGGRNIKVKLCAD